MLDVNKVKAVVVEKLRNGNVNLVLKDEYGKIVEYIRNIEYKEM